MTLSVYLYNSTYLINMLAACRVFYGVTIIIKKEPPGEWKPLLWLNYSENCMTMSSLFSLPHFFNMVGIPWFAAPRYFFICTVVCCGWWLLLSILPFVGRLVGFACSLRYRLVAWC